MTPKFGDKYLYTRRRFPRKKSLGTPSKAKVSRQRIWQLRKLKKGLCMICGKKLAKLKTKRGVDSKWCSKCRTKARKRIITAKRPTDVIEA